MEWQERKEQLSYILDEVVGIKPQLLLEVEHILALKMKSW